MAQLVECLPSAWNVAVELEGGGRREEGGEGGGEAGRRKEREEVRDDVRERGMH